MEENNPGVYRPNDTSQPAGEPPLAPVPITPPSGFIASTPPPAPAPEKRGRLTHKTKLLIGVVLVVVVLAIIAAILAAVLHKKPAGKSTNTSDAGLVINRAGYPNAADNGSADPMALTQTSTGNVISYQGQNIIQACNILNLQDIRAASFLPSSSSEPGTTTRTFFDGIGAGPIIKGSDLGLPFDQDTNSCLYKFEGRDDASIDVYQSSYVNMGAVNSELHSNYVQQADSNGFKVYLYHDTTGRALPNSALYILTGNDIAAQVIINTANTGGRDKLLGDITTNVAHALTTPTPLLNFTYKSPIFNGSIASACDLTDNTYVKALFSKDASPLVNESLSNAIGIVSSSASGKKYNYASSSCTRRTPADTYLDAATLRVDTSTYETVEGAKELMQFDRSGSPFSKNIQSTPSTVGDESFYGDVATSDNCLVFRKGRVLVYLTFNLARGSTPPPASVRIQALMPIAQDIAQSKLKGF